MPSEAPSRRRAGELPTEATSFIDRKREIAEARRLLTVSRLLTLTGMGGVGKTRLALRVAAGVRRAFVDGVWLVELAALVDGTLLEQTVADTVGLRDQHARSPRDAVVGYLRDKRLLLVLDNCEHLRDPCAVLATVLLSAAPGLRILATSRQALGTAGEHLLEVPPLPVPDSPLPGRLDGDQALRLFVERARLVLPRFEVTRSNRVVLARICRRLDGLPLAIELAAARLRVLAPEQILLRLDDRFRLLMADRRVGPARHQTLRAVVDWSYALCSPAEQTLWARTSVFAGGFDLDAVEAVCAGDGIDRDGVLDLVAALLDKSILVREDHGARVRYRQLDTVAHYGQEALRAAGQDGVLRRRHRDYYLDLAGRSLAEWFGPHQLEILARVRPEHANLRLALEFCVRVPGEAQAGLRLAAALSFYWHCGFLTEGRHWLDRALAQDAEPTPARTIALRVNATLALAQGDLAAAAAMAAECANRARARGDEKELAYACHVLGSVALSSGDLRRGQVLFEEAMARFTALGELTAISVMAYASPTAVAVYQGELARAVAYAQHARELCEERGEQWARAYTVYALALAEWKQGELVLATTHTREALRVAHAFDDMFLTAAAVERLACVAGTAGEHERTAVLLGVASTLWPLLGGQPLSGARRGLAAHEEAVRQARGALGDRAYEVAFGRGAGLGVDQAVAYALDERPEPVPTTPGLASTSLTRREWQVAELVAAGLSNKDIAARLVIAQRTVETHVQHILAKLGFTSRTHLAAWVVRQERDRSS